MCDANSLAGALTDGTYGLMGRADARSRGSFEAGMMEAMATMASAQARADQTALRRSFKDQLKANVAAMAVTGLDPLSFKAVREGNKQDLRDGVRSIARSSRIEQENYRAQGAMRQIEAEAEGLAMMMNGFLAVSQRLDKAEQTYQDTRKLDETRPEYFKRSLKHGFIGSTFFRGDD